MRSHTEPSNTIDLYFYQRHKSIENIDIRCNIHVLLIISQSKTSDDSGNEAFCNFQVTVLDENELEWVKKN